MAQNSEVLRLTLDSKNYDLLPAAMDQVISKIRDEYVQDDLLAVAKNCEVSGLTEDCVCIVADFNQNDVYLVSAQQVQYYYLLFFILIYRTGKAYQL